jgi:hypothetical protein
MRGVEMGEEGKEMREKGARRWCIREGGNWKNLPVNSIKLQESTK